MMINWNKEIPFFTRWYYSKPAGWIRRHDNFRGQSIGHSMPLTFLPFAIVLSVIIITVPRTIGLILAPFMFITFLFIGLLWISAQTKPKR